MPTNLDLNAKLISSLTELLSGRIVKTESEESLDSSAVVAKVTLADGREFRVNARPNQSKESSYQLPKYLVEQSINDGESAILEPFGYLDDSKGLIYRHIDGQTLRQLLPGIAVEPWYVRAGQLLRRLHDTSPPNFLKTISALEMIESFGSDSQATVKAKELALQLSSASADKICHGDPNPSNIIINEKSNRLILIDFSASGLGDAMMDVAILLVHSKLAGAPTGFETAFWRGYGSISDETSRRLKLWRALIYAHNALYIETWLSEDDPTRPKLINDRLAQAEREINR